VWVCGRFCDDAEVNLENGNVTVHDGRVVPRSEMWR
jgi:hypothetical protein